MTTVEDDFTGYLGARWPSLVRTLVLLGCPMELAPDVVTAGLARCRRGWREASEHDDLEVVVHAALLDAWDERLGETWWHGLRPPDDDAWPLPDLSVLDRLTPEVRAGLVFRRFSSLDAAQAAAIAGREAGGPLPHTPDAPALRAMADSVVVYAPPPDAGLVDSLAVRRRRRVLPIVAVLVVALALGGGTWWANRVSDNADRDGSVLRPVEPSVERNAAEVAWYAEGVLHLTSASYPIPGVRQFAVLGAGAVYSDADGAVVHLADDGTRTVLGTMDTFDPLVASDTRGQVAWVTGDASSPRLVVYDLGQAGIVGELDLPPSLTDPKDVNDTRAVAFDADRLYYLTSRGWGAWVPGEAERDEAGSGDLYDVSSRTMLFQVDSETIALDQPLFNIVFNRLGRGGELSADGDYALTRGPDDGAVLVYDTRSGDRLDVAPPSPDGVIDAVLAPAGAITYLTQDPDSTPVAGQIVTCQLGRLELGQCGTQVTFMIRSEDPHLAH